MVYNHDKSSVWSESLFGNDGHGWLRAVHEAIEHHCFLGKWPAVGQVPQFDVTMSMSSSPYAKPSTEFGFRIAACVAELIASSESRLGLLESYKNFQIHIDEALTGPDRCLILTDNGYWFLRQIVADVLGDRDGRTANVSSLALKRLLPPLKQGGDMFKQFSQHIHATLISIIPAMLSAACEVAARGNVPASKGKGKGKTPKGGFREDAKQAIRDFAGVFLLPEAADTTADDWACTTCLPDSRRAFQQPVTLTSSFFAYTLRFSATKVDWAKFVTADTELPATVLEVGEQLALSLTNPEGQSQLVIGYVASIGGDHNELARLTSCDIM